MSPAWIRVRELAITARNPKGGRSYQVLYRRGGRGYRIQTAGSFRTRRDANLRRDLVSGWLAAGRDPAVELAALTETPEISQTVSEWAARYEESRIDFARETQNNTRSHLRRLANSPIAGKRINTVTVADIQELVAAWSEDLKPSSVGRYFATVRLIFDFADVTPNPARDSRIRMPSIVSEEILPPPADHVVAMLDRMPRRYWLPLIVAEQTAMRVGEIATLQWGDVDEDGCRFRLRARATKTRRSRWVQVPEWLMEAVAATVAREDRTDTRQVFQGFTGDVAKNAMARGCRAAGIPVYSPHDLRHRRLSLWHNQGVPAKQLAERAGHSRASMTLDVYSHVMPLDEVPAEDLRERVVMTP